MFHEAALVLLMMSASTCLGAGVIKPLILEGGPADCQGCPYPYVVRVENFNPRARIAVKSCTGTIIDKHWVLTANACKDDLEKLPPPTTIRAGITDLNQNGTVRKVFLALTHPKADWKKGQYAVSLLRVDPPFEWSRDVAPVGLPEANATTPADTEAWVAAWGSMNTTVAITATHLQEAKFTIISDDMCKRSTGSTYHESQLCANSESAMCYADEGGPLVANGVVYGTVHSFDGVACKDPTKPQIFMKISAVRGWIKEITGV